MTMLDSTDETRLFQQITAQFDTPAFLRRARRVEEAWDGLLHRCSLRRNELLKMPKLRLGVLFALTGDWQAVGSFLAGPADAAYLKDLHDQWQPRLRVPVSQTSSRRKIRSAIEQLCVSLERFNKKWKPFVLELDLTGVNALRAGYNKFYVLEKECSVRSCTIAREGFVPLVPATHDDVFTAFPLLRVPRLL